MTSCCSPYHVAVVLIHENQSRALFPLHSVRSRELNQILPHACFLGLLRGKILACLFVLVATAVQPGTRGLAEDVNRYPEEVILVVCARCAAKV